ncbi:hypothetical protein A3724_10345, partial [Alcanivorax sp. HI0033]
MSTVLLVIIVVGVAVLLLLKSLPSSSGQLSYRRKPYLLSKAERSFYGVLCQAVGDNTLIFSKVRVADVLAPQKGLNRSSWQGAFNKISAKHIDFLLCDPQDCAVKLAIELDDASHGSAKRQKRDAFLEQACESAGLPLLIRGYGVVDIRQQVEAMLFPVQHDSSLEELGQIEGQGAEVTKNEQERVDNHSEQQAGNEKEAPTEAEVVALPIAPA